ncbi:hypothetical protein KI387_002511, partial [Taxus chinensis]
MHARKEIFGLMLHRNGEENTRRQEIGNNTHSPGQSKAHRPRKSAEDLQIKILINEGGTHPGEAMNKNALTERNPMASLPMQPGKNDSLGTGAQQRKTGLSKSSQPLALKENQNEIRKSRLHRLPLPHAKQ